MESRKGIFQVRSYDGKITKNYRNYKSAYKYCNKLISTGIECEIIELICDKNADGTDNIDTLKWVQVIGC